jgi:Ca2+-binding RTX toxin-like protein
MRPCIGGVLAALTTGCLLAAAPSALAQSELDATALVTGGVLSASAADPARGLDLVFEPSGTLVRVRSNAGAGVSAGSGCLADGATALCGGVTSIEVSGTPLADTLRNSTSLPSRLDGGDGPDALFGGTAADVLDGGSGDDTADGGGGDDRLAASPGADVMRGGAGIDTADYSARSANVTVRLDDEIANDGAAGEFDRVDADVENVIGGAGADVLEGADGVDNRLEGGARADLVLDSGGNDALDGGDGDDLLTPGAGADDVRGGDGVDRVSYGERTGRVVVSLDDVANDGSFLLGATTIRPVSAPVSPEADNVHSDVENVSTGSGNDVLIGSAGANSLDGNAGDDAFDGGAGPDVIDGGGGDNAVSYARRTAGVSVTLDNTANDGDASDGPAGARDNVVFVRDVIGGSGPDTLVGDVGGNVLSGGPGDDDITGLRGSDTLRGDAGNDRIHANDGVKDTVNCGADTDQAELDLLDAPVVDGVRQVPATCETTSVAPAGELPTVTIVNRSLLLRAGHVRVRLSCPSAVKTTRCEGRLKLAAPARPRKALASATYRLRRGGRITVSLRLGATRARTLLAIASGRGSSGRPHVTVARLTTR